MASVTATVAWPISAMRPAHRFVSNVRGRGRTMRQSVASMYCQYCSARQLQHVLCCNLFIAPHTAQGLSPSSRDIEAGLSLWSEGCRVTKSSATSLLSWDSHDSRRQ